MGRVCAYCTVVKYILGECWLFVQLPLTLQERVRGQLTRREILELEDDDSGESAVSSSAAKPVSIPIPTFPPTAAVCAVRPVVQSTDEQHQLHRVNTVPMSLVAQAMFPPDEDTDGSPRRRRGDVYVCSVCRRCSSAVDASSSRPATLHVTSEQHSLLTNAIGVHSARKSPTHPNFALTRSWSLAYQPPQLCDTWMFSLSCLFVLFLSSFYVSSDYGNFWVCILFPLKLFIDFLGFSLLVQIYQDRGLYWLFFLRLDITVLVLFLVLRF